MGILNQRHHGSESVLACHIPCFKIIIDIFQVHRVLPEWLDKPTVITDDLQNKRTSFDEVKSLDPNLKKKLHENGIKDFFPGYYILFLSVFIRNR